MQQKGAHCNGYLHVLGSGDTALAKPCLNALPLSTPVFERVEFKRTRWKY